LFCATAQTTANVYIWEVTTTMKLGEFSVPDVPIIMSIKVSFDNKNVLILVSKKKDLNLFFVGNNKRVLLNDYNGRLDERQ
jgi:hypothetical protein